MGRKSKWGAIGVFVLALAYYLNKEHIEFTEILSISTGSLKGSVLKSRSGKPYEQYLGIPYAKPPLGDLRFEDPQTPENWAGIRDATKYGNECVQLDIFFRSYKGDEDCLYLNVYTPNKERTKKYPILVFIHGGLFITGSSNNYRGSYFMDEEVILVTINYRLGPLGFLNSGDGLVRGNMGLKDQTLALKWVQENIHHFGGNKDKVTIFGESAGGASVHYHMLSPLSKGLFHVALSQSGTALNRWALYRKPKEQTERYAKLLDCPTNDTKTMIACLKKVNPRRMVGLKENLKEKIILQNPIVYFVPTIETVKDHKAFLTQEPIEIIKSGKYNKVPWITGVVAQEGLLYSIVLVNDENILTDCEEKWYETIPKLLKMERNDRVAEEIRKYYFGSDRVDSPNKLENYTNMFSDNSFFKGIHDSAILTANQSSVYLYYYKYSGKFSLANFLIWLNGKYSPIVEVFLGMITHWVNEKLFSSSPPVYGVCHADEIGLQFDIPFATISEGSNDYEASINFVKMTAKIAQTDYTKNLEMKGVIWEPAKSNKLPLQYLEFNKDFKVINEPFEDRLQFHKTLGAY